MKDLQKKFTIFAVMIFIVAVSVFVVNDGTEKTASSQSPKSANNSVKSVKKRVITPNRARSFLNDLDMPTRDYLKMGLVGDYGQYEADSDNLILETRDPDRFMNSLSYSVFGDKHAAKAVEIDLGVNDMSFSSNAVGEFIKYSDHLMYKVTNKHLTPQIKKAMQSKTSGEWVVDGYEIKLKKEIFPEDETSDQGAFSLSFIIEL